MKNAFKSIGSFFKKGGNSVANGAKSIFSKGSMNTFRDHLQDTLKQQGGILQTVGKGMSGASLPLMLGASILAPELIPVFAGLGAAGVLTGLRVCSSPAVATSCPRLFTRVRTS
jgi:hypothetical protein